MNNIARLRRGLSPERKGKIAARTATIVAEERSLRELRRAHKLTQKKMAEVLGIGRDSVSRLEQRSDLLISTRRGYVEAMGGSSRLSRSFPTRNPWCAQGSHRWSDRRERVLARGVIGGVLGESDSPEGLPSRSSPKASEGWWT